MTRPPLTKGRRAARLTSELDPESREVLRGLEQGKASVFLRQAVCELLAALEAGGEAPRIEPGPAKPFAWKAPQALVERMRRFVGPGQPYSCLSHLVRAAIRKEATHGNVGSEESDTSKKEVPEGSSHEGPQEAGEERVRPQEARELPEQQPVRDGRLGRADEEAPQHLSRFPRTGPGQAPDDSTGREGTC